MVDMSKDPLSYYSAYSNMFKEQNMKDKWIYERNQDTGEIRKRKSEDYGTEQLVNPAVNSVPRCEEYIWKALNLKGQEWIDFINSLTEEQKIKLSQCWD